MEHLWLYALFVFGIIVVPGMDMAFVLSSALTDGRRAGMAAVAGTVAGGIVHLLIAALGIGLLLRVYPAAFNAVLLAGALYVAWMGIGLWRHPATLGAVGTQPSRPLHVTFWRAMATCLLNPKAYIFMVAVFPQFLRPDEGPLLPQLLSLGTITAFMQAWVYGTVALGAAWLRSGLSRSTRAQALVARSVAALLVGTAVWTLWQGWTRLA